MNDSTWETLAEKYDSTVAYLQAIVKPFADSIGLTLGDVVSGLNLDTEVHQEDSHFFRGMDPGYDYGNRANWECEDDMKATFSINLFSMPRTIDIWPLLERTFTDLPEEVDIVSVGGAFGQEVYSLLILLNGSNVQQVNAKVLSKNLKSLADIKNKRIPHDRFDLSLDKYEERALLFFTKDEHYAIFNPSLLNFDVTIEPVYADLETPQGRELVQRQSGNYVFFAYVFHHLYLTHQKPALEAVRRAVKPNGYLISDKCEQGIEGKVAENNMTQIIDEIEDLWRYNAPRGAEIETGGGLFGRETCTGPYETLRKQILSLRQAAKEGNIRDFNSTLSYVCAHISSQPSKTYHGSKQALERIKQLK